VGKDSEVTLGLRLPHKTSSFLRGVEVGDGTIIVPPSPGL
jgi:hypothetical protein